MDDWGGSTVVTQQSESAGQINVKMVMLGCQEIWLMLF